MPIRLLTFTRFQGTCSPTITSYNLGAPSLPPQQLTSNSLALSPVSLSSHLSSCSFINGPFPPILHRLTWFPTLTASSSFHLRVSIPLRLQPASSRFIQTTTQVRWFPNTHYTPFKHAHTHTYTHIRKASNKCICWRPIERDRHAPLFVTSYSQTWSMVAVSQQGTTTDASRPAMSHCRCKPIRYCILLSVFPGRVGVANVTGAMHLPPFRARRCSIAFLSNCSYTPDLPDSFPFTFTALPSLCKNAVLTRVLHLVFPRKSQPVVKMKSAFIALSAIAAAATAQDLSGMPQCAVSDFILNPC